MQLHVPEDFTCLNLTSGIHYVCYHKAATGHEDLERS